VTSVARRLILTEGAPLTLPQNAVILHSEVVSSDGEEVLELWISAPAVPVLDDSGVTTAGPHTIYTRTEVHDDDEFMRDIENSVQNNLAAYEDDDDWNS